MREKEIVEAVVAKRENTVFLPGIELSPGLIPVVDLLPEARDADIIIFAVPSKYIRKTFQELRGISENKIIVNLSKGFEYTSLKTISHL